MSDAWRLFQLQKADTRTAELEKILAGLRGDDAHQRRFAEAEARHQEAEAELRLLKKELREREHEDTALRDRCKALEGKLYGGRVTNPKELSGYQEELRHARTRLDALEEDMLLRMEALEAREGTVQELLGAMDEARKARDARQAVLEGDVGHVEAELAATRTRRGQMAAEFSPADLKRYEDLRSRKHGVAVARIVNHSCDGCRMHLTDHKIQQAKGTELTFCSTCGRILYLEG